MIINYYPSYYDLATTAQIYSKGSTLNYCPTLKIVLIQLCLLVTKHTLEGLLLTSLFDLSKEQSLQYNTRIDGPLRFCQVASLLIPKKINKISP